MAEKYKTELALGFSLKQDYKGLIHRAEEQNKKLKNKSGLIALVIGFITIIIAANPDFSHVERRELFLFGFGAAIVSYFYFKYKHKSEIASNISAIQRWDQECELQKAYVTCLYELEQAFEKSTNTTLAEKVISLAGGLKSSGVKKK